MGERGGGRERGSEGDREGCVILSASRSIRVIVKVFGGHSVCCNKCSPNSTSGHFAPCHPLTSTATTVYAREARTKNMTSPEMKAPRTAPCFESGLRSVNT